MKKYLRYIIPMTMALVVCTVPSFAAEIDSTAITAAFSDSVNDTIDLILGIAPVGLTLFALSFGLKKGMALIRGM